MTFTELYETLDILNDRIRNETNEKQLKKLLNAARLIRHKISKKNKEVIKQIEKQNKIKLNGIKRLKKPLVPKMGKDWSFKE